MEKVGQANFFRHVHACKDFPRNSWDKWKKLAWSFQARSVEKVGQANFFHDFRDLQNFLRNYEEVLFTMVMVCFVPKSLKLLENVPWFWHFS